MLLRDFFSTCAKRIVAADCEKSLAARALLRRHKLLPPQISRLKELTSLMRPAEGFPFARAMKRKIICHLGPTNSGKTYAAIEALKASGRGVYCAPLRLLAQEMFDKLNAAGTACSLRTGEITKLPSVGDHLDWNDAPVVSCTVEMLNLKRVYKVAVIDEIQLLADPQRGWAFSQALLGCNAERVYLCGEAAAKPLIEKIIADCGEEVEFVNFERLTPLTLLDGPLPPNFAYQTGDCIVSFSRKNIFRLRSEIERKTKKRVAVVYGALPAENRALQAAQFNDEQSGVDILVASDAIGMGLNLNIKRIIFDSLKKFDGEKVVSVPEQQIRQIAGRAGRFNTAHEEGQVTCVQKDEYALLAAALKNPTPVPYERACLAPTFADIERIQEAFPNFQLGDILDAFVAYGSVPEHYFLAEMKTVRKLLELLIGVNLKTLELEDLFTFLSAPVKVESESVAAAYLSFASYFVKGLPCPVTLYAPLANSLDREKLLLQVEETHKALEVYLWLNTRFPHHFPHRREAERKSQICCDMIERMLAKALQ